jgi:RNA recognition motif-containing protein
MSVRIYVGNLPKNSVEREQLQTVFSEFTAELNIKVIKDRKTSNCRGFAFVTVADDETADKFIEQYNGQAFMDNELKVEKAQPRAPEEESTATTAKPKAKKGGAKQPAGGQTRRRQKGGPVAISGDNDLGPDPRWAKQLQELKERMAAQTVNS